MANTAKTLITNFIHEPPVCTFSLVIIYTCIIRKMAYYTLSKSLTLSLHYCKGFFLQQVPKKNFSVSYTFILLLNDTNFYYKNQRRQFSNGYLARFSTITCCTLSIYTFQLPGALRNEGDGCFS